MKAHGSVSHSDVVTLFILRHIGRLPVPDSKRGRSLPKKKVFSTSYNSEDVGLICVLPTEERVMYVAVQSYNGLQG